MEVSGSLLQISSMATLRTPILLLVHILTPLTLQIPSGKGSYEGLGDGGWGFFLYPTSLPPPSII